MSSYKNIRLSIISVKHKKYKEMFNFKKIATKTKLQQHTKDFITTVFIIRSLGICLSDNIAPINCSASKTKLWISPYRSLVF